MEYEGRQAHPRDPIHVFPLGPRLKHERIDAGQNPGAQLPHPIVDASGRCLVLAHSLRRKIRRNLIQICINPHGLSGFFVGSARRRSVPAGTGSSRAGGAGSKIPGSLGAKRQGQAPGKRPAGQCEENQGREFQNASRTRRSDLAFMKANEGRTKRGRPYTRPSPGATQQTKADRQPGFEDRFHRCPVCL